MGDTGHVVTTERTAHLERVLYRQDDRIATKYWRGQQEHGGKCWEKPGMLDHALDEAADLPVYLWTLREQLLALATRCDTELPYELRWVGQEIRRCVHK